MSKILKINKPSDYSSWVGQSDPHELISVINYCEVSPVRHSLNNYDVYGLFLQGKEEGIDLIYGRGQYDYSEGTLICVAPGQLGGKEDTGENMKGPYDRCPAYIFVDNEEDCNGGDNLFNQIKYEEAKLIRTNVSR
ncbi:MAG: hypothetical protein K2I99_02240, partial [Bacteroidaceae bacterium]|nr:hypothetical protein [Bacteroidaceae bacterium]